MVSRILGFVRDAVLMANFSRTVTDAFIVAFRLPNLVRRLLGEGSLSISFIPVYVDHLSNDESGERAKRLADATYTLLSSVTVTLSVLAFIFMEPLLNLWVGSDSGFAAIPGKFELTVTLARIMTVYIYLVTLFAFFSGVANSLNRFFIPALAPAIFNFTFIIFALLPHGLHPVPGVMLAWGVVLAGVLQTGIVALMLYRTGHLPRLTMKIRAPGVRTVLGNLGPGLAGLGVFQIMTIANTFFAARLPEGTQTYIWNSDRILELPQSIIAISLGTALLPTFSRLLAKGDKPGLLKTANEAMRTMLFLALPSAIGMYFLAFPIIAVLFMRGQYGVADVTTTAAIVQVYSVLLLVSSLAKVTVPGFYAMKNTWLPAALAAVSLVVHLLLAQAWVDQYGVIGLAGATAISGSLNMLMLQFAFRYMIGPIGMREIFFSVFRMIPGLIALSVVLKYLYPVVVSVLSPAGETLARVVALSLSIALGVIVYFGVTRVCQCPEAIRTLQILQRRRKSAGP